MTYPGCRDNMDFAASCDLHFDAVPEGCMILIFRFLDIKALTCVSVTSKRSAKEILMVMGEGNSMISNQNLKMSTRNERVDTLCQGYS